MEMSTDIASTCLSLTCTRFYAISRDHFGNRKVPLYEHKCAASRRCCQYRTKCRIIKGDEPEELYQLLEAWVGPNYTFVRMPYDGYQRRFAGIYLNKNTYPATRRGGNEWFGDIRSFGPRQRIINVCRVRSEWARSGMQLRRQPS